MLILPEFIDQTLCKEKTDFRQAFSNTDQDDIFYHFVKKFIRNIPHYIFATFLESFSNSYQWWTKLYQFSFNFSLFTYTELKLKTAMGVNIHKNNLFLKKPNM